MKKLGGSLGWRFSPITLVALLAGCGLSTGTQSEAAPPFQAKNIPVSPAYVSPGAIPFPDIRLAAGLTATTILGKDAEQHSAGAAEFSTALSLDASVAGSPPQYALYRFNPGFGTEQTVTVVLDQTATTAAYIGLADFATGRWNFTAPTVPPAQFIATLDNQRYVSPGGDIWLAVVASAGERTRIDAVSLISSGNYPPHAKLNVDHTDGPLPYTPLLDASASDPGTGESSDQLVNFEWDFDGDGVYDYSSPDPVYGYTYRTYGAYPLTVRVTDSGGLQATVTATITAGLHVIDPANCKAPAPQMIAGNPAVGYYAVDTSALFYKRSADTGGRDWPTLATAVAVPAKPLNRISLAAVDGTPAIAYTNDEGLFFVTASDALGANWNGPLMLDSCHANWVNLLDAPSGPMVAYWRQPLGSIGERGDVCFMAALDAAGSTWGTALALGTAYRDCSIGLILAAGNPAICFHDHDVYYRRASVPDGSAWDAVVTALPGYGSNYGVSMCTVTGRPAIAASNEGGQFSLAGDATGTVWPTPTPLPGVASSEWDFNLTTVNGLPAIAAWRRYFACSDGGGTQWEQPLAFSSDAGYTRLLDIGGRPAVVFCRADDGALCFAKGF